MRKIFNSKKALSPVVAAIILIAVTVAVSIAVAAWMGALTFTFMKTEQLEVVGYTWASASPPTYIDLKVKNTGTAPLTVSEVRVNNNPATLNASTTWNPGDTKGIRVTYTYASGTSYEFAMLTTGGKQFSYLKASP
jgi:flagellin-like protein